VVLRDALTVHPMLHGLDVSSPYELRDVGPELAVANPIGVARVPSSGGRGRAWVEAGWGRSCAGRQIQEAWAG